MKLNVLQKDRKIDSSSDESIQYGIDTSQIGLLYEILSQYSNPVGSIVRELTTNAFDAHIESKSDKRVTVEVSEKNELTNADYTFTVKDSGIGLSPDRVRNVYSRFLASTKRDSNEQHGAFGLGSKSPFSYTDLFYAETVHAGIEYFYAMHKGKNSPSIDLLSKNPTDKPNGTSISINIKPGDTGKFRREIKRQLAYFDNINHINTGVDNNYRIFQGNNFVFREHAADLGLDRPHICLGKVYYPIDTNIISLPSLAQTDYYSYGKKPCKTPIGLKFEIGEIPVIRSRENLEYTDEAIDKIKEKFEAAKEELQGIYDKSKKKVHTVPELLLAKKVEKEKSLSLPGDVLIPHATNMVKMNVGLEGFEDMPNYPKLSEVVKLVYKTHKRIGQGRASRSFYGSALSFRLSPDRIQKFSTGSTLYRSTKSYSTLKNKYLYDEVGESVFYIVRKRSDSDKATEANILRAFGYDNSAFDQIPKEDVANIKKYTSECLKIFHKITQNYDNVVVPKWFKDANKGTAKKGMYDPSTSEFKPELKIHLKRACSNSVNSTYGLVTGFSAWEPKLKELVENPRVLTIYGFQDDSDLLEDLDTLLHRRLHRFWSYNRSKPNRLLILKIAKSKEEIILATKKNAIHVNEFVSRRSQLLVKTLTYFYIYDKLDYKAKKPIRLIKREVASKVLKHLGLDDFNQSLNRTLKNINKIEFSEFPVRNGNSGVEYNIPNSFQQLLEDPAYLNPHILEEYKRTQDFINKYPLLYKIMITEDIEEDILEELPFYLKGKSPINPSLERRLKEYKEQKQQLNTDNDE